MIIPCRKYLETLRTFLTLELSSSSPKGLQVEQHTHIEKKRRPINCFSRGYRYCSFARTHNASGLEAHVRLTCCNQGRVVQKLVNGKPGLKVNQSIIFLYTKLMFFTAYVLRILRLFELKTKRPDNINRKYHRKITKTQIEILALA